MSLLKGMKMKKINLNRLTVYHIKGGTGKTRIALNLALTLGFGVVTNDPYSVLERSLPKERRILLRPGESLPEIPETIPIIFDLGGYPDYRSIWAMRKSQVVIFPVLANKEDLQIGLDFLPEIRKHNRNIIIVVNRTSPGEFVNARMVFRKYYPDFPVFEIKESRAMSLIVERCLSIAELAKREVLHRRYYEKVDGQFEDIIVYMKKQLKQRRSA